MSVSFVFYFTLFRLDIYLGTKLIRPIKCVSRQKTTFCGLVVNDVWVLKAITIDTIHEY